jgi:predicted ester cyclase
MSERQERVERNKEVVRRYTEEAWGRGDLSVVDELVAPDATPRGNGEGTGPEAYRDEIARVRAAISEYRTEVLDLFGEGDRVAIRWHSTGRHTGPVMGVPPTGNQIDVTGVDVFQVVEGKIVALWGETAVPTMLRQIGALPPAGLRSE